MYLSKRKSEEFCMENQEFIFFQKVWDKPKNVAITIIDTIFILSHAGVGQAWDKVGTRLR